MKSVLRKLWLLMLVLVLTGTSGIMAAGEEQVQTAFSEPLGVSYRAHVQNMGDMPKPEGTFVVGPEAIGTRSQSLRVEGFWIELTGDIPENAGITYQVHVQNKGWTEPVSDGTFAGTTGKGLRIESIRILLDNLEDYDVYYRGHVQNRGDLPQENGEWGWVKNGEDLGTTGSSLRLEELQVKIVRRDTDLSAYNELIETIGKLSAADYTPQSWETLQTVIADYPITEASLQEDVDAAVKTIEAAYQALALKVVAVYDTPGTYGPESGSETIDGSVVIAVSGVTLQNLEIMGDLTIAEEVGDGDATLNDLTVRGNTNIYGGGSGQTLAAEGDMAAMAGSGGITINGGDYASISIVKNDDTIMIVANGSAGNATFFFAAGDIQLVGAFENVYVMGDDVNIQMAQGSSIENLDAGTDDFNFFLISHGQAPSNRLTVSGEGTIKNANIANCSKDVVINVDVTGKAAINGENTTFNGTVNEAEVNGDNTTFKNEPDSYQAGEGKEPVIVNPKPAPPAPPSGGGGGGISYTPVTAVTISGTAVAGQTLTATATPGAATVSYQWLRSDMVDGSYGNIAAATGSTYVLDSADAGKYIKVQVTGTGTYTGTVTSAATGKVLDTQAAPTGLNGVAATTVANNNGKITDTTTAMEYKLAAADDSTYQACAESETGSLSAGDYVVRYQATTEYAASETTAVTVPNQEQSAPSGLLGIAPTTVANNDGKITGTTTAMEYKLAAADDSTYQACAESETGSLSAGNYAVRYQAKTGFNVGSPATVTVTAYVASNNAGLTSVLGETDASPGGQSGEDTSNAITWAIAVDNAKDSLGLSDISVATGASIKLYSDSIFATEISEGSTIPLSPGADTIAYIKVTAQDGTTSKYYAVTVSRAADPANALTISNVTAGVTSGTTVITISNTIPVGNKLVYVVSDAEVTEVTVETVINTGTDLESGTTEIGVSTDRYVTVYEINSTTQKVVNYVSRLIADGEFNNVAGGLTVTAEATPTQTEPGVEGTIKVSVSGGTGSAWFYRVVSSVPTAPDVGGVITVVSGGLNPDEYYDSDYLYESLHKWFLLTTSSETISGVPDDSYIEVVSVSFTSGDNYSIENWGVSDKTNDGVTP